MKACICANSSFSVPNHRLYFFAKELTKRGVDLTFVVPGKKDAESCKNHFKEANVIDVGLNVSRFNNSKLILYPMFSAKAKNKLQGKFDFLYGICLPAALAVGSVKSSSKKIIDYIDLWSEYWKYASPSLKGKAVYSLVKYGESHSLKKADMVLTITKKLAEQLKERGCEDNKLRIVRDGVDLQKFNEFKVKDEFYEKYNLEKGTDYVTFQGGIAAHDGVQFMVDAAPLIIKQNPEIKFLIVGTGIYEKNIREIIAKKGLNEYFKFTGWVNSEEMPSFMNVAKINCIPLPDSPATHGVVTYKLFEGMACGTPAVIGAMPAVRDLLNKKDAACLVKSEHKEELANGINELLNNKAHYEQMKQNGLSVVKNHDWRDIAKDMADIVGA